MDREKVIEGLECHQIDINHRINCADCPYYVDDDNHIQCVNDLHHDALALLKEQEAVVRCCDCEHWDSQCHSCEHFDGIMQPDFYCADGVKRDDGQ